MSTSDINMTVRQIVNALQRRQSITETSALAANATTKLYVDFLNDTIDECSDMGDWKQFFKALRVSAVSSTGEYEIATSAPVKNIDNVYFQGRSAPLSVVDFREIIRLRRTSAHGVPYCVAIVDTSGVNPKLWVHPIPGTNEDGKILDIQCFEKQRLFTAVTADSSAIPNFPSLMLVNGTHSKVVLDEAGNEETEQYKTLQRRYLNMQREAYNRLTADMGGDLQIVPK